MTAAAVEVGGQGDDSLLFLPAHKELELAAPKELQCVAREAYQFVMGGAYPVPPWASWDQYFLRNSHEKVGEPMGTLRK